MQTPPIPPADLRPAVAPGRGDGRLVRQARRRLTYVTPANADKVLKHDRYWSADFCALYLEACDLRRVEDPSGARRMAIHLPGLLELVGTGERPEQYRGAVDLCSMRVRAWAMVGDCERLTGRDTMARTALGRAAELASAAPRISLLAAADLHRRQAALVAEQGGIRRACLSLQRALDILGRAAGAGEEHARPIAEASLMLGALDPGGLPDLARAVAHARPKEAGGALLFDTALDLFDGRLDGHPAIPGVFDRAGHFLKLARRQPLTRGDSLRRLRLSWSEGRVLAMLGIGRLAERRLERARRGFAERGDEMRLALTTLDLVLLDVGQDDRRAATRRLEDALLRLSSPATDSTGELAEVLRQARGATFTSLHVFRRRLARRLGGGEAPRALIPVRRPGNVVSWPLPANLGALHTEKVEGCWRVRHGRRSMGPGSPTKLRSTRSL